MLTFTTLGYGDVTLPPDWRLLASFEAANGNIMLPRPRVFEYDDPHRNCESD